MQKLNSGYLKDINNDFLNQIIRETHVILTSESGEEGKNSRYFGRPWMPDDAEYPEGMGFVCQLDIQTTPGLKELIGLEKGLLLLFIEAGEYYPEGDGGFHVIITDTDKPSGLRDHPKDSEYKVSVSNITGYLPFYEYPSSEELMNLKHKSDRGFADNAEKFLKIYNEHNSHTCEKLTDINGNKYNEFEGIKKEISCLGGNSSYDKIGGWPSFEQGDETPNDANGNRMTMILQIGFGQLLLDNGNKNDKSEKSAYYGTGHLFYSKETKEFRYVWACD